MKRILLLMLFVTAAAVVVHAQDDSEGPATPVLSERQAEAQVELDMARQAFDRSKYTVARRHAEKASLLDPTNSDGLIIIARSVHALYRWDDDSPANLVRAREAIAAYLRVPPDPDVDEAYEAVNNLYQALGESDLQYSWILQRARNYALPISKQVAAYLNLIRLDISASEIVTGNVNLLLNSKRMAEVEPASLSDTIKNEVRRGQDIASRGRQMVQLAIALDPDNEYAPSCDVQLLTIIARLFQLEGKDSDAEQQRRQARHVAAQAADRKAKREAAELARMINVDCGELCDKVVSTPLPIYPPIAKAARVSGTVMVYIEIDENGKVSSATISSGHPLLCAATLQAARLSTFSRTLVNGRPVRINSSLVYNFVLP